MKTPADFLNAKQAAKYLGFSYEMTRAMFRLGQLPTVKVKTMRLTTKAALDEWVKKPTSSPSSDRQDEARPEQSTKPGISGEEFVRLTYR